MKSTGFHTKGALSAGEAMRSKFYHTRPVIDREVLEKTIKSTGAWSSANMYRTSTSDMRFKKEAVNVKGRVISGYAGHIPGHLETQTIGRTFNDASRKCFKTEG